jgi:HlyD family secretion protein
MKTVIGIILLGAVVAGLFLLNDITRTTDGKSMLNVAGDLPVTVETTAPEARGIIRTVQAPGDVEPLSEVDISAEVVAKILEMPVEEGDVVQEGDLLCRLDDAVYRARLTSAEANVAKLRAVITQAKADLAKAERDYRRQVRLAETDATSATELADYRTALVRARALDEVRRQELIEAQARLQSANEDLAKTVITAPISGVVSQLFAKQGEVVVTGTMNNPGTRIMVISDLSKMQVRCRVDEGDAVLVEPGQTARIYLQSDTRNSVPGHVLRVAAKGTRPQGRDVVTFETLILLDAGGPHVKPGMTASVEIEVARSENALTVPVEAVVHRKRKNLPKELVEQSDELVTKRSPAARRRAAEYLKIVFCVEDGVAHPRLVETGISDETSVEILSGVASDARVVIGPYRSLDQLKDGSKVKIEGDDGDEGEDENKEGEEPDDTSEAKEANTLAEKR